MAAKSALKILTEYFNVGDGKRPLKVWSEEVKALTDNDKRELALGICVITGEELA